MNIEIINSGAVCHTKEQCKDLWSAIPNSKKEAPLAAVRENLHPLENAIRSAYESDPEHWICGHHFWWGMHFRNWLREQGWGEDYWPVHNLDCIYVQIIEAALGLPECLSELEKIDPESRR